MKKSFTDCSIVWKKERDNWWTLICDCNPILTQHEPTNHLHSLYPVIPNDRSKGNLNKDVKDVQGDSDRQGS
jgi:hypothetical protein